MKIKLTDDQERAKNLIAEWYVNTDDQIFVLSGYAGTGKTFLIDYVVRKVLGLKVGSEAVFVSPTGKAAANLVKSGTLAGTVHSLIYIRDEDDFDVDEHGEIVEREELSFIKKDKIDEKIKLIIIDEASMINETVLNDLLSFKVKCLFSAATARQRHLSAVTKSALHDERNRAPSGGQPHHSSGDDGTARTAYPLRQLRG